MPVVRATVPLTVGAMGTQWIFDLVVVLVVVYTLVQAPTLAWVARRLGVVESVSQTSIEVETTPLEELNADLMSVSIGPESVSYTHLDVYKRQACSSLVHTA